MQLSRSAREGGTLHLVGGSWRHFAALHRRLENKPIPQLIEGYALRSRTVRQFARKIAREKPSRLKPLTCAGPTAPARCPMLRNGPAATDPAVRGRSNGYAFRSIGIREGLLVDWLRSGELIAQPRR